MQAFRRLCSIHWGGVWPHITNGTAMSDEKLWLAFGALAVFMFFVVAKVYAYMRESETQWRQVDRSKLQEWEDDED